MRQEISFLCNCFPHQHYNSSDTTMSMFSSKNVYQATAEENIAEDQRGEHEGVKYLCRQCGKHFSKKGHLATHKKGVHEGVKYPCSKCEYRATTRNHLAKHHRAVHEGVKYTCVQCGKHFSQKGSLDEHQKMST